jgi:hypothetical protein
MKYFIICLLLCLVLGETCNEDPVPPTDPPSISGVNRFLFDSSNLTTEWVTCEASNHQCLKSFNMKLKFVIKDEENQTINTNWVADVIVESQADNIKDVFIGNTASDSKAAKMGRFNGVPSRDECVGTDGTIYGSMLPIMRKVSADNGFLELNIGSTRQKPDGLLFPPYGNSNGTYSPFNQVIIAARIKYGKNTNGVPQYRYACVGIENKRWPIILPDEHDLGLSIWVEYDEERSSIMWRSMRARWLIVPEVPPSQKQFITMLDETSVQWTTYPCIPFVDSDGDGVSDYLDNCPNDPNKTEPGINGCGNPENSIYCNQFDFDNDGDIDQDDFGQIQLNGSDMEYFRCCTSGPNIPYQEYCE